MSVAAPSLSTGLDTPLRRPHQPGEADDGRRHAVPARGGAARLAAVGLPRPRSGGLPHCTPASPPASSAAPRARRPAAERVAAERPRAEPRPSGIPPGPVLMTVFGAGFDGILQALLDDPEMRALLAASPQAGRILRPLWRKLGPPSIAGGAAPAAEAAQAEAAGCEAARVPAEEAEHRAGQALEPPPATAGLWEPTPCLPPWPD